MEPTGNAGSRLPVAEVGGWGGAQGGNIQLFSLLDFLFKSFAVRTQNKTVEVTKEFQCSYYSGGTEFHFMCVCVLEGGNPVSQIATSPFFFFKKYFKVPLCGSQRNDLNTILNYLSFQVQERTTQRVGKQIERDYQSYSGEVKQAPLGNPNLWDGRELFRRLQKIFTKQ